MDTTNQEINPSELRRKIMKIAKDLFLNPDEDGKLAKQSSPSKKQIKALLTPEESEFYKNNPDLVFPKDMPERAFFDAYSSKNMDRRRKVLLRMVAEDNCLKYEKKFAEEHGELPLFSNTLSHLPEDEQSILREMGNPISSTIEALNSLSLNDKKFYLLNGTLPTHETHIESELSTLYSDFIKNQREPFYAYMKFINNLAYALKKFRLIHDRTILSARIKGSNSALTNDSSKALDDVFGMEIDFTTDKEKELLENLFASTIQITKIKRHNKPNGYIAYHCTGYPTDLYKNFNETQLFETLQHKFGDISFFNILSKKIETVWNEYKKNIESYDNLNIPMVEWQFKTNQVAIDAVHGNSAHTTYKNEDPVEVQRRYSFLLKSYPNLIPTIIGTMWQSEINGQAPRELTSLESIKKVYPFFIDPKDLEDDSKKIDESNENKSIDDDSEHNL